MKTTDSSLNVEMPEERLRKMAKALPEATPSPWFTRMVLNRLPEKRRRVAMRIEYCVYFAGLIWMAVWGCVLFMRASTQGVTVGDLLILVGWFVVSGTLIYAIAEPRFMAAAARREARRLHNERIAS